MKRLCWIFIVLIMILLSVNKIKAAEENAKFLVGNFEYTIFEDAGEHYAALTNWGDYYDYYGQEIIIPENVEHNNIIYKVKEIKGTRDFSFDNITLIDIPASITKIEPSFWSFEADYGKHPVKIIIRCSASALGNVRNIDVNSPAIESIIYVTEEEYDNYKPLIEKTSRCIFYDTEDVNRSYCGIKLAKLDENDVVPLGFIYDGASYKVLDEKKRTVALIEAGWNSSFYKNGLYEQPEKVYYKDKEFAVTEVDYFAFYDIKGIVKLPKSITKIAKECFGQYVTKVDLSETKVKTIPSDLFLNYGDNDDSDPIVSEVILPKGCKKIESNAFYRCKNLKNITIPKKVTKIGEKAFNKKCKTYYIKGDTLPSGLEIQPMKKATIYVKSTLLSKAKKVLKSRISAGDCVVKKK